MIDVAYTIFNVKSIVRVIIFHFYFNLVMCKAEVHASVINADINQVYSRTMLDQEQVINKVYIYLVSKCRYISFPTAKMWYCL